MAMCMQDSAPAAALEAAREALGAFPRPGVTLTGHADYFGTEAELRLELAADGRFRRSLAGPLRETVVFDGAQVWAVDNAGIPYQQSLLVRELELANAAVLSGRWADAAGPLQAAPAQDGALELSLRGGSLQGRLELDPATHLPRRWRVPTFSGEAGLDLEDWRAVDGVMLPHQVGVLTPGAVRNRYRIERAAPLAAAQFEKPARDARDAHFDPAVPAEVPVRRAVTGHPFVRPLVDGQDLGWFAFDTGAAVSVITRAAADQAGMASFGQGTLLGAGSGVADIRLRRGRSLELGPLRVDAPVWSELPPGHGLEQLSQLVDGEPVGGIIGWDVLIRSVVELDLTGGRLALRDPARYALPEGVEWQPLLLHRRHPFVQARYEAGGGAAQGWFCVDSGAGTTTVAFHADTVRREHLLEGREARDVQAFGAGGALALKLGSIDWFEVAGRRWQAPAALFSLDAGGAFADSWVAGTLGHVFFAPWVIAFDYGSGRVAFLPKPEAQSAAPDPGPR